MREVSDTPPGMNLPTDEAGQISADLPCFGCGYSLRGLHQESKCPECGLPVARSLDRTLLRFADPAWVRSLADGMRLISGSMLISLLLLTIVYLLMPVVLYLPAPALSSSALWWYTFVFLYAASALFYVIGVAKFTRRDPASAADAGWDSPRIMRAGIFAYSVFCALWLVVSISPGMVSILNVSPTIRTLLHIGINVAALVATCAMLPYADALAGRVISERQRRHVRTVLLLVLSFGALFLLLWILIFLQRVIKLEIPALDGLSRFSTYLWGLAEAWAVFVLWRFGRAFRRAADEAKVFGSPATPSIA